MIKRLKQLLGWSAPAINTDAFSSSQVASKLWLVERLEECLAGFTLHPDKGYRIWILGGWYGITNLILRTRDVIPVEYVRSIDCDPSCEHFADKINKFWEYQAWQFKAQTADANKLSYDVAEPPHIVINTSVEHMASCEWFDRIPGNTIVALQGSDLPHDDHVNYINDAAQLKEMFPLKDVYYEAEVTFTYPDYSFKRSMIIGMK
jgi:hypothetical protein